MNVGTLDNQGWEIALFTTPYKSKDISVDFNFNLSANENVIREISELYPSSKGEVTKLGDYLRLLQVNNPFGSFYGYKFKGVYKDQESTIAKGESGKPIVGPNGQTVYMRFNYPNVDYIFQPGDAMYEDVNHDGNINYMDVVYLGNSNPKLTGGFGPTVTIKNQWKISTYFNFRYDYDIVNGTKMNTTSMYGFDNQSTAVLRRWRKEGDVTTMPRLSHGDPVGNARFSSRWIEDGSYARFKAVTLGYNFPLTGVLKGTFKTARVSFTAQNLYTITGYKGYSPDVASVSNILTYGVDYGNMPQLKTFLVGLKLGL